MGAFQMTLSSEEALSSEVIELIIRVEFLLNESRFLEKNRKSALITYLQHGMEICRESARDGLQILYGKAHDNLSNDLLELVYSIMLRTSVMVHEIILRSRFLQKVKIRHETGILFDELFRNFEKEMGLSRPSVILLPEYNYSQRDIELKVMKIFQEEGILPGVQKKPISLISYPNILYRNPLMWGILVHEIGHKIDKSRQISEKIIEENDIVGTKEKQIVTVNWFSEFFADLFAVRILGPAFPVSYITYCLLLPELNVPHVSHPSDSTRIAAQKDYLYKEMKLGSIDFLQSYLKFFSERIGKLPSIYADRNSSQDLPEPICSAEKMVSLIKPRLESLPIETFTRQNLANSKELANELSEGIPVSSTKPSYKEIRKKLNGFAPGDRKIKSVLHEVLHTPSKICEILNAGWIDKQKNGLSEFKERFISQGISIDETYQKAFENYGDHVFQRDVVLLKSIEMSRIHQIYGGIK